MKKVYAFCPGGVVTGGPELLHQLVGYLNERGVDAYLLYHPFSGEFAVPGEYQKYNVKIAKYADINFDSAIVILPEVATRYTSKFKGADIYIWWLSVDNYVGKNPWTSDISYVRYALKLLARRIKPLFALKQYRHLVQSEYARLFLQKSGIAADTLSDYIADVHLLPPNVQNTKSDAIAYNPAKGYYFTKKLINRFPKYKFVALQGMTSAEVRKTLEESKIYIDFGSHPGKDRFPREAAMAGCCVITGRKGSAGNSLDVPIPDEYKLSDTDPDFNQKFETVVDRIFSDFERMDAKMNPYREKISGEKAKFFQDIDKLFGLP